MDNSFGIQYYYGYLQSCHGVVQDIIKGHIIIVVPE
jgi:hypothetical protein